MHEKYAPATTFMEGMFFYQIMNERALLILSYLFYFILFFFLLRAKVTQTTILSLGFKIVAYSLDLHLFSGRDLWKITFPCLFSRVSMFGTGVAASD